MRIIISFIFVLEIFLKIFLYERVPYLSLQYSIYDAKQEVRWNFFALLKYINIK